MGGIASFLFEGRTPPSVTTTGSTTSNIPQWMEAYNQALVAKANQIAAEPYQAYGGPRVAGFTPDTQNAFSMARTAADAYKSPLAEALGLTEGATGPGKGGLATATPYMTSAAQTFPGAVSQYMDPYVSNVIDRAKLEANRNYTENILPALSSKFTASGQYGSSAMAREANRAARDLTEGLQSNAQAALSGAYTNAGQMFGADQSRQLGLAQLAGNLGVQQQLGELAAGKQLGALGEASQALGLTGANALNAIGTQQQQQEQKNLDLAYQDFQNQKAYPRQNVDWLSSIINGMPHPTSSTEQRTGPATAVGPSGLQQLGSAASAAKGIYELYKDWRGDNTQPDYSYYDSGEALDDALLEQYGITGDVGDQP
jgi:hypothetical protein